MKQLISAIAISVAASTMAVGAQAAGYPWKNHAAPYFFVFENEIDTHQQTRKSHRARVLDVEEPGQAASLRVARYDRAVAVMGDRQSVRRSDGF